MYSEGKQAIVFMESAPRTDKKPVNNDEYHYNIIIIK